MENGTLLYYSRYRYVAICYVIFCNVMLYHIILCNCMENEKCSSMLKDVTLACDYTMSFVL